MRRRVSPGPTPGPTFSGSREESFGWERFDRGVSPFSIASRLVIRSNDCKKNKRMLVSVQGKRDDGEKYVNVPFYSVPSCGSGMPAPSSFPRLRSTGSASQFGVGSARCGRWLADCRHELDGLVV